MIYFVKLKQKNDMDFTVRVLVEAGDLDEACKKALELYENREVVEVSLRQEYDALIV